ncbi:MAG: putative membrane protein YedE/YeeE [Psychroserpens sp.]
MGANILHLLNYYQTIISKILNTYFCTQFQIKIMQFILDPWPWYVCGPLIAIIMFTLIYFGKTFGMSSNLRTLCTIVGAGNKVKLFDFDWKTQRWNLTVVVGAIIGGFIAHFYLSSPTNIDLNPETIKTLSALGFENAGQSLLPPELYSWKAVLSFKGMAILIIGGLLVGFGTRYAGGCTSGHAITGLSSLQLPSLIAVIGFFLGGLIMTHLLFPLIFG